MNSIYNNAIDFLFNQLPAFERIGETAYKPGLERVLKLSHAFDEPHKKLKKVIHIAGTNGKGSTAHTLAAILQSAGYKTGLFTSPHLVDFRERIRINGEMISKECVVEFVDKYKSMPLDLYPSFFELTTILAFQWFVQMDVDVAIIEVGLGGRLDSTNIVNPILSIVTNISLDHTSLLGNTPEAIAMEKAGIIKNNTPVIIGEADEKLRAVFINVAKEHNAPILFTEDICPITNIVKTDSGFRYTTFTNNEFNGELSGDYQSKNAATVITAVEQLRTIGFNINSDAVALGFGNVISLTGLRGRWMKISNTPLTICDTGHNPGGWEYLINQINELPGHKKVVVGFVADKDVYTILQMIAESVSNAQYYFTAPRCPRGLATEDLKKIAKQNGIYGTEHENVIEAYKKALADCDKGDSIFIGGSNYLIAELLASLED